MHDALWVESFVDLNRVRPRGGSKARIGWKSEAGTSTTGSPFLISRHRGRILRKYQDFRYGSAARPGEAKQRSQWKKCDGLRRETLGDRRGIPKNQNVLSIPITSSSGSLQSSPLCGAPPISSYLCIRFSEKMRRISDLTLSSDVAEDARKWSALYIENQRYVSPMYLIL